MVIWIFIWEDAQHTQLYTDNNICDISFTRKHSLKIHIQTIHEGKKAGKKPFKCNICEDSFKQKTTLKIHIARTHSGKQSSRLLQNSSNKAPVSGNNPSNGTSSDTRFGKIQTNSEKEKEIKAKSIIPCNKDTIAEKNIHQLQKSY